MATSTGMALPQLLTQSPCVAIPKLRCRKKPLPGPALRLFPQYSLPSRRRKALPNCLGSPLRLVPQCSLSPRTLTFLALSSSSPSSLPVAGDSLSNHGAERKEEKDSSIIETSHAGPQRRKRLNHSAPLVNSIEGNHFIEGEKSNEGRLQILALDLEDEDEDEEDEDEEEDEGEDEDIIYAMEELVQLEGEDSEDSEVDVESPESEFMPGAISNEQEDGHWESNQLQRIETLLQRAWLTENYNVTISDIESLYNFRLDRFQRLSIEAFLKGSSVVVSAPTSSGKTLVAEAAAVATMAWGKRLFYTTPLKALSNQKLREFRGIFGEANVGLVTGDASINNDAPIVIMTTEILRNMLYESVGILEDGGRLQGVQAVVLDEVHYLSDISRGTVWEETIIYCPKDIQLVCLSATVANPDELAGWIAHVQSLTYFTYCIWLVVMLLLALFRRIYMLRACVHLFGIFHIKIHGPTELVTAKRRPVPLTWNFSTRYSLLPLLNEQGTDVNRQLLLRRYEENPSRDNSWISIEAPSRKKKSREYDHGAHSMTGSKSQRKVARWDEPRPLTEEEKQFLRRRQVPQMRDTLMQLKDHNMLPAIWFIFSRKGCDTAVKFAEEFHFLSEDEQGEVEKAIEKFKQEYPESVRESSVSPLLQGIAAHHAGCLPLWKAFIEDLFQRGLVKVVFATETLAAGINMPARTTVISSLSKRGDSGHSLLRSSALLQMAGRAGRRGIDEIGHVVVVQTPFEGAEDCCKLLLAGPDPLVSQFTASYGMVLNLLGGVRKKFDQASLADGSGIQQHGSYLDEARALVERSFGNYIGSDVTVAAKQRLSKLQEDIEKLQNQTFPSLESRVGAEKYEACVSMKRQVVQAKVDLMELRTKVEQLKEVVFKPVLEESLSHHLPCICIRYYDIDSGSEVVTPVLGVSRYTPPFVFAETMEEYDNTLGNGGSNTSSMSEDPAILSTINASRSNSHASFCLALGSDKKWYLFTERSIKSIYKTSLPKAGSEPGGEPLRDTLMKNVPDSPDSWKIVGRSYNSHLSTVWRAKCPSGACLAVDIPQECDPSDEYKISSETLDLENIYFEKKKEVSRLRKKLKTLPTFKLYNELLGLEKLRSSKISELEDKKARILSRMSQMQPSGWTEFLQVVRVLEDTEAITKDTHMLLSLGETAAKMRGVNELWFALVFSHTLLSTLDPPQLAAVCGSLVSEGLKMRSDTGSSFLYSPSVKVEEVIDNLEDCRQWLLGHQTQHGVRIPCDFDVQFCGLVEAWASGVTWRELLDDCLIDEGDVARLLRRSIDLLAQLPSLKHLDPKLQKTARLAATVMDRPPISELIV